MMTLIRRYCGSLFLCLLALVMLVALCSLGVWQLNRAAEKEAIIISASERMGEDVFDLSELVSEMKMPDGLRYRRAMAEGVFLGEKQFLLDNQVKNGRVGYNVLTPLKLSGGAIVLVDRGWVPQGISRELKPDVAVDSESAVRIEGTAYIPLGEAYSLGGMDEGELVWPRVIQYLDFEEIGRRLGVSILPLTLRMDPGLPGGYLREWAVVSSGPEKHLAYAFQWFAMAFVLLVLLIINAKRHRNDDKQ